MVCSDYFFIVIVGVAGKLALDQWQYEVKDNKWVVVPLNKNVAGNPINLMIDFGVGKNLKK